MNYFDNFLSDIDQGMGSLSEVKKTTWFFEEYRLVLFDYKIDPSRKVWYLVGSKSATEPENRLFTKPELLLDIIRLGIKFEIKYGQNNELAYTEEIINFCMKYGHPFESEYFRVNAYKDKEGNFQNIKDYASTDGGRPENMGYCAFGIMEFKRKVLILHDNFQLWYGLFFDDIKKVLKYSYDHSLSIDNIDEKIPILKELFPLRVGIFGSMSIKLEYDKNNDNYHITPDVYDVFSTAYFQLAMLILGRGEKGVKFCSTCGAPFEFTHGNTKNCTNCQKEYQKNLMRKIRSKKKGVK